LRPLKREVTGDIGTVLCVVMGALSLVFLLVCANVANLVLVRAQARTQGFAIRAALGAGWMWIARELLVESLTLGLFGGVSGIALAYGAVRILKAQDLTTIPMAAVAKGGVNQGYHLDLQANRITYDGAVNVISAPPVKQPIIENAVYEREEAIAITGFSLSTLIRAEKSGGLKGRHKGRRRYYLGSDLLKWLQEEHYGLSKVDRRQRGR